MLGKKRIPVGQHVCLGVGGVGVHVIASRVRGFFFHTSHLHHEPNDSF